MQNKIFIFFLIFRKFYNKSHLTETFNYKIRSEEIMYLQAGRKTRITLRSG